MSRHVPRWAALFLTLALASASFAAPAEVPFLSADAPAAASQIWVAWLDGRSLDQARSAGALLLDRFPDAVIVADATSAGALAAAGFRVEKPVKLAAGRTVTLLRDRDRAARASELDPRDFEKTGAELVWRGGRNAIATSDGPLSDDAPWHGHARKVLRTEPLRRPLAKAEAAAPATLATAFSPAIDAMVGQVSQTSFMDWIRDLANVNAPLVGGVPTMFPTRGSATALCDKAEQYVYERFQALGFTDVQYDPYSFSSTNARNVIATLPGVETPQRIVVIGGHLDSTSPQISTLAPGANDNASGTAGVLEIARILKQYTFKSTIRFIAFTGEEQGLYGSQHYANAAAARGDSILGAVIFDMIAWKDALYQIDIEGETPWLPVMNVMNDACARYTGLATSIVLDSWGSDHVPFQDNGFPSFLAIESEYPDYPCYHQTCDTLGWNLPGFGCDVVRAGLATVAQLAVPASFTISHAPLASTSDLVGPYEVVTTINRIAPLMPDSLLLHWSTGGAYVADKLLPTGTPNQYHAFIPGQPAGTHVTYWLSAVDSAGGHTVEPSGAPSSVHEFWVSPRTTLFAEGFETGAPGWTHGGSKDDWQFAAPAGLVEDPATAYAGAMIAGTDITGLGVSLGKYENNADSWLESPAVNCSLATQVHLTFARDLAVERSGSGIWDYARVFVNGTKVWESPSGSNLNDAGWTLQDYDISALADGKSSVRVRFTIHSDGSLNFGGWNLDDVKLTGISTAVTTDVAAASSERGVMLYANTPNPYRRSTTLRFALPSREFVDLSVYDVRGRLVRTLVHESREAGDHAVVWDGRARDGTPSTPGIYFYRLSARGTALTRKMALIR